MLLGIIKLPALMMLSHALCVIKGNGQQNTSFGGAQSFSSA
jgi:hypothetical protein